MNEEKQSHGIATPACRNVALRRAGTSPASGAGSSQWLLSEVVNYRIDVPGFWFEWKRNSRIRKKEVSFHQRGDWKKIISEVADIHSQKILIADDEYLIRWSLAQALTQEGYEVVAVEDGKKAVEAVKVGSFDFIITDLVMPELDGWEVLEFVRQIQTPPRVILITAHGKENTEKISREKGVWAYVEKPFIISKIKSLLKKIEGNQPEYNIS